MEIHSTFDKSTPRQETASTDECFEMVEYIAAPLRESLCSDIEKILSNWLLSNSLSGDFLNSRSIKSGAYLFELSYICHPPLDLTDCYPHPLWNELGKGICSSELTIAGHSFQTALLHRWIGSSKFLLLQTQSTKPEPFRQPIQEETKKVLLSIGKKALGCLGLSNMPLLSPSGVPSKRQFDGVVYLPFPVPPKNKAADATITTKQEEYKIIVCDRYLPCASGLPDLKKIIEYYGDIIMRHYEAEFLEEDISTQKTYISAEYHYVHQNSPDPKWNKTKNSFSLMSSVLSAPGSSNSPKQPDLIWGPSCDPLRDFELSALFSKIEYTTDLEFVPETAASLHLTAHFSAHCSEWALLTEILQSIVRSWVEEETSFVFPMEVDDLNYHNQPTFDVVSSGSGNTWSHKEIDTKLVVEITTLLFSDNHPQQLFSPRNIDHIISIPSAVPYRSLLWQLSLKCLNLASSGEQVDIKGLLRAVWSEVVRLLRWHWESGILIPNINTPGHPGSKPEVDLRFTLLHQKMAMLNYCIARQSERTTPPTVGPSARGELHGSPELLSPPGSFPSIGSSAKVSQEPHSSLESRQSSQIPIPSSLGRSYPHRGLREGSLTGESFVQLACPSSVDSYNSLPEPLVYDSEGRLEVLAGCRLLYHDEPIYIPITQDPGVMTEDMLRDQAQLFERLGTSAQATRRRAQLQGAHLLSDMEAFKAANPRSSLGDFVRWYSPRDWVSNSEEGGQLSARMGNPDNIWQELWLKAEPTPAHRQKPLFDSMTEGEKALHYLENLSTYEVFVQLLPTMFLVAYDALSCALPEDDKSTFPTTSLSELEKNLVSFPWGSSDSDSLDRLLKLFRETELLLGRVVSLSRKLPGQARLIKKLATCSSHSVVLEPEERKVVMELFTTTAKPGRFVPPLARFEPTLAFPAQGLLQPQRREIVCENSLSSDVYKYHRVYMEITNNHVKVAELFPTEPDYYKY